MIGSPQIDAQTVGRRCSCQTPNYRALSQVDWIVLDFVDGTRTFEALQKVLPIRGEEIKASYYHLLELGFLTWDAACEAPKVDNLELDRSIERLSSTQCAFGSHGYINNGQSSLGRSRAAVSYHSGLDGRNLAPHTSPKASDFSARAVATHGTERAEAAQSGDGYGDDLCRQYLPPRLIPEFKKFEPSLVNPALEIPVELQIFTEFLSVRLASLSHYDLLGLEEGRCTKADVKQAYVLRTKQFHPDRYFRKNIGPFAPRLSAIFKAITTAFSTLQRSL